ncbi:MAG TPA: hypothetical protein VIL55_16390 [Naasia sp.]|jgi:thymidylate kinase
MPRLVVITGPIGAGKSTVSSLLAERLLGDGLTVVVADVDDVAAMAHTPAGGEPATWEAAHRAHSALVRHWLTEGVDVVIAHGPIYTAMETAALLDGLPPATDVLKVLVSVDYDVALHRVAADTSRGLSRDPGFLRATHDRFARVIGEFGEVDLEFDTAATAPGSVVDRIADALAGRRT